MGDGSSQKSGQESEEEESGQESEEEDPTTHPTPGRPPRVSRMRW